ncbi:hypothetical protein Rs2_12860 [Raphanus sativus]|nr:hypothetical protein Rs2_12860 [Raphanus sativus]
MFALTVTLQDNTLKPLMSMSKLTRLRSSEAASSSSICQRLSNLQDLHDSLEKMICLSINNQALSQEQIEKLLDGSLKILDLCNIAKEDLSQMKEGLMEIQSILRRKRGDLSAESQESLDVFGEAKAVTVALFQSLFNFMSGSKACAKWSLVSTLMNQNKITFEEEANEFTVWI